MSTTNNLEARLHEMGLARPRPENRSKAARRLRRLCKGKFGNMSDDQKEARQPDVKKQGVYIRALARPGYD